MEFRRVLFRSTPEMFFDYLGVRRNGPKAAETEAVINVDLGTEGGKYLLELGNGVLNHTAGVQVADADASITLTRDTLNRIILQEVTLADAISAGDIELDGEPSTLEALVASLDTFEFWFSIGGIGREQV